MENYTMQGTCARSVNYQVDEKGKIKNVEFINGCDGTLKGLAILLDGMDIDDAIAKLKGITCGTNSTSCPDQLAKALVSYKSNN